MKRPSTARASSRPTSSSWTSGCRAWTGSRRRARSCRPRPRTKVILITIDESRGAISQAIQAGVSGYLLKDASADALVDAARNAIEGNAVIHPQLTKTFIEEVRMGDAASDTDAAVQARTRDPPAGRRRRHHEAGRDRSRDLPAHREDPPRAHLREARRERPRPGGRDRDPHRHRALTPSPRNRPASTRLGGTDTVTVKVLLCDTADEVTRLQHRAARCSTLPSRSRSRPSPTGSIEMAAGLQPDVVVTELGLEGLKDVNLVRRLRDAAPLSAIVGWTRLRDPGRVALVLAERRVRLPPEGRRRRRGRPGDPGGRERDRRAHPQRGDACSATTSRGALARVRELEEQIRDMETQMAEGTDREGRSSSRTSRTSSARP